MNIPLPALKWLRTYDKTWLRGDLVAGITLAAYLLPAGLGDASLANLRPQAGLFHLRRRHGGGISEGSPIESKRFARMSHSLTSVTNLTQRCGIMKTTLQFISTSTARMLLASQPGQ